VLTPADIMPIGPGSSLPNFEASIIARRTVSQNLPFSAADTATGKRIFSLWYKSIAIGSNGGDTPENWNRDELVSGCSSMQFHALKIAVLTAPCGVEIL